MSEQLNNIDFGNPYGSDNDTSDVGSIDINLNLESTYEASDISEASIERIAESCGIPKKITTTNTGSKNITDYTNDWVDVDNPNFSYDKVESSTNSHNQNTNVVFGSVDLKENYFSKESSINKQVDQKSQSYLALRCNCITSLLVSSGQNNFARSDNNQVNNKGIENQDNKKFLSKKIEQQCSLRKRNSTQNLKEDYHIVAK